jgi:phosphoribosyl 1,2-cyclic phosphate phosphodiesterase
MGLNVATIRKASVWKQNAFAFRLSPVAFRLPMELTFLGTGTSMGVPVIGCDCGVCTSPDPRNRRMRTAALLRGGGKQLLIDAGPDFRAQMLAHGVRHLDALLLTHAHFDHVAGIDDLRPLNMRAGTPMPVYGSAATLHAVRERFAYAFAASSEGSTRPALELRPLDGPFELGELAVMPLEVLHGSWAITGYRIGALGYVTDASVVPPETMERLGGLDVLVLNALRHEPHPTHLSVRQALGVIEALRPRRALLVHMTHDIDHASVSADLPAGVELAYDGLVVEVCA